MAMPDLSEDYFGNTLTYICEHNDEGAMGIVINRPTDVSVLELLAKLNMKSPFIHRRRQLFILKQKFVAP